MEFITQAQGLWNEYYPIILSIFGTIAVVGGTILTLYIKFKPAWDVVKEKINAIFDKSTDEVKEDISAKLQVADIEIRIAELEDKIASPITSEASRAVYTTQLKVLIEVKTKLDTGVAVADNVTSKY